ncbi:unnamed protein product [Caenorhabditis angaria]|uniref:Uncharacterized protein n=1 Tax=Caenorhabditis angaria TaxID=860376 RepID=A0A9P1IIC1_9PELO|nr:unnamed protein product [Caenorhabditis angaria]
MMRKYNLTKEQLKMAKQEANQQRENWIKYKKEQVLDIFGSKSKYVSKSAKSDVMHPHALRKVTTVINKEGKEIPIEFGKRLEILLELHRPNPKFHIIKSQISTEKSKNALASKFKQRHKLGNQKDRSKDKKDKYNQMRSSIDGGGTTGSNGGVETTGSANIESSNKENNGSSNKSGGSDSKKNDDHINSTDSSRKLFPKDWYALSSSRILVKKGRLIFWQAEEGDEQNQDFTDDDQKFSVTTDVVLEVLEGKREVRTTNLKEPGDGFGDLKPIIEDYKISSLPNPLFDNTLKGTVDFESKKPKDVKSGMSIHSSKNQWEKNCEVFVFKGETMKRLKNTKVVRKTEILEDIIRKPDE